jgi:hypothetical protein
MVLTPGGIKFTFACRFWSSLFTQEIYAKKETFGISSPSTLEEDHEARQESRHVMNMTPNDLRTEVSTCKSSGTQPENSEACIARIHALTVKETTSKAHMQVHTNKGSREKRPAWADRPSPLRARFASPFCPRCLSINCLCLRRPPHPSIHQRATKTKEKHREEAGGRRESSSCLGDGLGHPLATMVGPAW